MKARELVEVESAKQFLLRAASSTNNVVPRKDFNRDEVWWLYIPSTKEACPIVILPDGKVKFLDGLHALHSTVGARKTGKFMSALSRMDLRKVSSAVTHGIAWKILSNEDTAKAVPDMAEY